MPLHTLRGVMVDFPFDPYECQLVYMEKVIQALQERENALLESPTGTGKTLSLLCAVLSWRKDFIAGQKRKQMISATKSVSDIIMQQNVPARIIYASRTHGQLSQVVKELKKTSFKPRVALLGSRKQLCIHHDVSTYVGAKQNQACRSLVSKARCKFQRNLHNRADIDGLSDVIMDMEDLMIAGNAQEFCPFYYSRGRVANAELIFMPYNYLIDPKIRASLNIVEHLKDAIIILDEAHNLAQVFSGSSSFDFHSYEMAGCIAEVQEVLQKLRDDDGPSFPSLPNEKLPTESAVLRLKEILIQLERAITSVEIPSGKDHVIHPGGFIFQVFSQADIDNKSVDDLMKMLEKVEMMVASVRENGSNQRSCIISRLIEMLNKTFYTGRMSSLEYFRTLVRKNAPRNVNKKRGASNFFSGNASKNRPGRILSFWCFNPGISMRQLQSFGTRSIVLTSGTLSPMDFFSSELSIDFNVQLENPHIVKEHQVFIGVLAKGPRGLALDGSYRNRSNFQYQTDLGNSIVNFCRVTPHGILAFFPSYAALERMTSAWRNTGTENTPSVMERIERFKHVIVEPRVSSKFAEAMEDYRQKVNDSKKSGSILFAACRGKSSEGMNFSDEHCRAVIIIGIPFPNAMELRVKLKKRILDKVKRRKESNKQTKVLSGDRWYLHQASCAVNQAAGRAIRHGNDYGAILLCDSRYSRNTIRSTISQWLRPHMRLPKNFGQCLGALSQFFKNARYLGLPEKAKKKIHMKLSLGASDSLSRKGKENYNSGKPKKRSKKDLQQEYESLLSGSHSEESILRKKLKERTNLGLEVSTASNGELKIHKRKLKGKGTLGLNQAIFTREMKNETVDSRCAASSTYGEDDPADQIPLDSRADNGGFVNDKGKSKETLAERLLRERTRKSASTKQPKSQGRTKRLSIQHQVQPEKQERQGKNKRPKIEHDQSSSSSGRSQVEPKKREGINFLSEMKSSLSKEEHQLFLECLKAIGQSVKDRELMKRNMKKMVLIFVRPGREKLAQTFSKHLTSKMRPIFLRYLERIRERRVNGQVDAVS